MKNAAVKDFFREIRKSLSRYLSLIFIVALGVAFFSGVRSSEPDMKLSADRHYDELRFFDIRLIGTLGLSDADVAAVAAVEGIEQAEGARSVEALCQNGDETLNLRVNSLTQTVSLPRLTSGRLPEKSGECMMDDWLISKYSIGDVIELDGDGEDLTETLEVTRFTVTGFGVSPDFLNFSRGTSSIGNGQSNGFLYILPEDFSIDYYTVIYASTEGTAALTTYSDAYEDAVDVIKTRVEALEDTRCEARYHEVVDEAREKVADARQEYNDKKQEADEKIADAEQKLSDGEQELADAEQKVADGEQELADARQKLADGEQEIEDGKKELADARKEYRDGRKKLNEGWAQYDAAEAELKEKEQELADAKEELAKAEETLAESEKELEEAEAELAKADEELSAAEAEAAAAESQLKAAEAKLAASEKELEKAEAELAKNVEAYEQALAEFEAQEPFLPPETAAAIRAQLEQTKSQLDAAAAQLAENRQQLEAGKAELAQQRAQLGPVLEQLKEKRSELEAGKAQLAESRSQLEAGKKELNKNKKALAKAEQQLEDGKEQLAASWKTLDENERKLRDAAKEIADGEQELADAEAKLEDAKQEVADGEQELADARQEIEDAKVKLEDGRQELEDAKAEAEEKLADADKKITDAEHDIDEIEMPEWYVLDRNSIQNYVEYGMDTERIGRIGKVFPAIFFLVAALVSLTSMTRMVEEKRTEIGTWKALGYGRGAITAKFMLYALSACVIGSVIGVVTGSKVLPYVILSAYDILYINLPYIVIPIQWDLSLLSSLIAIVCIMGATWLACHHTLNAVPAQLMRPAPPKSGKRILLERVGFIWRHLNFTRKATVRNLFRFKKRFFMTVFGIGGCMGLLLVGFGLRDSIAKIVDTQYREVWTYDASLNLKKDADVEAVAVFAEGRSEITEYLTDYRVAKDLEAGGVTKEGYLFVPEDRTKVADFLQLRDRLDHTQTYELEPGAAVITEKLAKMLSLSVGDEIILSDSESEKHPVRVSAITENYLYHYVYMLPETYEQLYGEEVPYNEICFKTGELEDGVRQALNRDLIALDDVENISFISELQKTVDRMMHSLDLVIWVLIISAGFLAFVVLYNLNTINITERRRELATLKVLGFYDGEVAGYVYRENVLLTVIGTAAGILIGIWLHRFVITSAEIDMLMFGQNIAPLSFLWSALLTFAFSVMVNGIMFFALRRIDMIESLKSVE